MAKKVLSIVIGTEYTKVCEVSCKKNNKNKGIRVYQSLSFPTPPNSIEDGYIRDKDSFGEELRIQLKTAKIKTDKVIFSVASSKIANREVMIPPVKEKRIMDIIKTGASEYFPIDLKEYILSYLILEKRTSLRKEKAIQKRLHKKEQKLVKQQNKLDTKVIKKKSKTDIIADNMELAKVKSGKALQVDTDTGSIADEKNFGKKHMRLSVFAVPASLVKNYYNFASAMNFDTVSIDYSGNSSYQMIKRQAKRGTNVFIQLNEQDTLISILRDDVLILQRTVGYGFSALIDAVMEQEILKVSTKEEAVQLLMKKNLLILEQEPKQPELEFDSSWTKGEAAAASEYVRAMSMSAVPEEDPEIEARRNIRESLHFLTSSIARMLDYYKSNHKETYFDMVYLCGTGIHTKGMDVFFQSEIGITHKRMEKLWTVSANKKATAYRSNSSEFMSCIGAVIKPLDFVPVEFLEKKQKRSAVIATVVFATVCLLGSAGIIYLSSSDYQAARKELNAAKAQYEAMPQLSDSFSEYDRSVKELEDLQKLENMTKSNNDLIKEVINELEKKLPTGTIINSMQFAETGVTMNVTVNNNSIGPNAMIAKLLIQLKTIKYFQNADISGISSSQENGITNVNFTITCTYSDVN